MGVLLGVILSHERIQRPQPRADRYKRRNKANQYRRSIGIS
jgi:hypothetical protein